MGVGAVVQVPDDLAREGLKGVFRIQLIHVVQDDVAGNDLILLTAVEILLQALLVKGQEVDPQDLFPLEHRPFLYLLVHESQQLQELLRADEQMHAHHHVEMADQLSRIIVDLLIAKETLQFFPRLVLRAQDVFQFLLLKPAASPGLQLPGKFPQLVRQVLYRLLISGVGYVQKGKGHLCLLLQIAEGIQVAVAGEGGGHRVLGPLHHAALHAPHKGLVVGAQRGGDAHVLGVVDKIVLQMISAHIAGETLDGQGVQAEALHQLAGGEDIAPHVASLPAQRVRHQAHHHGLQPVVALGYIFVGEELHPPLVGLKAEENLVPALLRAPDGLPPYVINVFIYDLHVYLTSSVSPLSAAGLAGRYSTAAKYKV